MYTVKQRKHAAILSITIATACWVVAGLLRPLYTSVDNFTISTVTNGLYGNEYYCIHLHPLLCTLINRLSITIPSADAFLLLGHILVFLETTWLIYLSRIYTKSTFQWIVYSWLVMFNTIVISLFNTNYTVQGASFVFTGWLTLFLTDDQHEKLYDIIGFLFVFFGTMWRAQAALVFFPFIMLELLSTAIKNKGKPERLNYYRRYGVFIIFILVLLISQNTVKNSSEYVDAVKYDQARTSLEDYPTRSWDEIKNKVTDINEIDYESVKMWFLADTDRLTPDLLKELSEVASTTEYPITPTGVFAAINAMVTFITGNSKIVWIVIAAVGLVFLRVIIGHLSLFRKLESVFAILGGFIILLYFTILGRAPLRVWYPVIYATLLILLLQANRLPVEPSERKGSLVLCVLIMVLSFLGITLSIYQNGFDTPSTALLARSSQSDEHYSDTYTEDGLYFWGAWHSLVTRYYMSQEKLPTEEFLNHNVCTGDWVYGQKYFKENLSDANALNPIRALLERNNTYFVSEDCAFILRFMHKYYGPNIIAECVGEIVDTPIWTFTYIN